MDDSKLIKTEYWFITEPSRGVYSGFDESIIMDKIESIGKECNVSIKWEAKSVSRPFGKERLAYLEGEEEDIEEFLKLVKDWM